MNYNDIVFVKDNIYHAYDDTTISSSEIFIFLLHRPDRQTILAERLDGTIIQFPEEIIEARTAEQTIKILNDKINYFKNNELQAIDDIARQHKLIEKEQNKIKSSEWSIPKLQANFDRLSIAKRLLGNAYFNQPADAKKFREEYDAAYQLYTDTKSAIKKTYRKNKAYTRLYKKV